jgi:energy-coupling factor transporter ATP-binding protein EcfA2
MVFQFSEEDFNRYVSVKEHGGQHIWHELEGLLKKQFGVAFSAVPYRPKGDWLQELWFAPKQALQIERKRDEWKNQAQFVLKRNLENKTLQFGLSIECKTQSKTSQTNAPVDQDGVRFAELLDDVGVSRQIEDVINQKGWTISVRIWDIPIQYEGKNLDEIRGILAKETRGRGWEVCILKTLSAEAAIAAGEEIPQLITEAFQEIRPVWEAIIPEADRKHLSKDIIPSTQLPQLPPSTVPEPISIALLRAELVRQGLYFTPWQVATFYTALQTKGFVILSGTSGKGKTRLAQAFAGMLPQPAEGANHLFVTVRPDWRDSKSLLGYYNPLTGTYEWTPFLRFLLRAEPNYRSEDKLAWFVILDEMNLAHVEYYFADLLSVLESGRDEDGWTREPLRLGYPDEAQGNLPPRELKLPPNLYIVGTVNVDETTHAFSPKVLDRAFTLELTDVDFRQYQPVANLTESVVDAATSDALLRQFSRDGKFARVEKDVIADYARIEEIKAQLQTLNDLLCLHDLHFAYRVFDEFVTFLVAAESNKLYDDQDGAEAAFDAAVLMKVLPKFHGSRSRLEKPLCAVLAWCFNPETPDVKAVEDALRDVGPDKTVQQAIESSLFLYSKYPKTAERVQRMLARLYMDGFAAFG